MRMWTIAPLSLDLLPTPAISVCLQQVHVYVSYYMNNNEMAMLGVGLPSCFWLVGLLQGSTYYVLVIPVLAKSLTCKMTLRSSYLLRHGHATALNGYPLRTIKCKRHLSTIVSLHIARLESCNV
ncbi:uncharacterized protein HD556DRAFT_65907 [Suillus plorans]|uniref:Uncharacterized protein n=1 Tax=Suillus plorans TaxID=116603 RepID=A0A9P7DPB3_9AGAM|nr:uncharacterized protein HD556DRAFT_65907 [Suillus plorans]KAG1799789.1 hypothetical protein HD556DRAFT_65907 [Suillus plorans]